MERDEFVLHKRGSARSLLVPIREGLIEQIVKGIGYIVGHVRQAAQVALVAIGRLQNVKGLLQVIGGETSHEHVQGDSHAPHVRGAIVGALKHFRGNVKGTPRKRRVRVRVRVVAAIFIAIAVVVAQGATTKINEPSFRSGRWIGEHPIFRLDIAVNDIVFVTVRHGGKHLVRHA